MAFLFRKNPSKLYAWCLMVASLGLALLLDLGRGESMNATTVLAVLISFSGCMVILARHVVHDAPFDLFEILLLLGLGLGVMWSPPPISLIFLASILSLLMLLQLRAGGRSDAGTRWVLSLYGLALIALLSVAFLPGSTAVVLLAFVYATLLPLFPFHGAYAILLRRLPGTQAAFLSVFLPALGLQGLLPLLSLLPEELKTGIQVLALLGLLVGGLRSLVQQQLPHLLSQLALVFWSMLWWYLADDHGVIETQALIFLSSAGLALSGLFLLWNSLKARYGNLLIAQFSGLATPMPRFAVLFVLFCMAGMGLPFFGLFSGFIALSFSASSALSWGLGSSLLAWLLMSWRFPTLLQALLFGKTNARWIYEDVGAREIVALSLILIVLFLLGIMPDQMIELETLAQLKPLSETSLS